jgi:hypothetical protein
MRRSSAPHGRGYSRPCSRGGGAIRRTAWLVTAIAMVATPVSTVLAQDARSTASIPGLEATHPHLARAAAIPGLEATHPHLARAAAIPGLEASSNH